MGVSRSGKVMGLERAGGGGLKSLQKSEVQMQALMDDDGSSWVLCRLQSFETRTGALGLPSGKEVGKHSLKAPVGVQDIGLVFIPCLIPVGGVSRGVSVVYLFGSLASSTCRADIHGPGGTESAVPCSLDRTQDRLGRRS